jgi:hypothetical protein
MGLVAGAGVVAFLLFLLVRSSLTDDAYITLAYAKNLALHLHWGLIPQEVANSATSPLNVLILAAVTAVTRIGGGVHPVLALGIVSVALAMAMAYLSLRVVRALRLPFFVGPLATVLVLANPFLLSSVGLEVLLIPALLLALIATAIEGKATAFGVVAGLALLTRLDLVVFVLPIAAASAATRAQWRRTLLTAVLVAAPWFVFSWFYFGSAVPDTLLLKTSQQSSWGGIWTYLIGPVLYYTRHPNAVVVAFLPAVIGVFVLVGWLALRTSVRWGAKTLPGLGPVAALGIGGIAYYAVYAVIGVGPYHWYYVAPLTALSIFLVIALGAWRTVARERPRLNPAPPLLLLGLVGLLALGSVGVDINRSVPWRFPVIYTNWAIPSDYARLGIALRHRIGSATVRGPGEIGTLAYFCNCAIVDEFSDRGYVVGMVNNDISHARFVGRLIDELNYAWLDRNQQPRHVDYLLHYDVGVGRGPDVWHVWSPWTGVGHFTLVRGP